jgi:hypothetical protein
MYRIFESCVSGFQRYSNDFNDAMIHCQLLEFKGLNLGCVQHRVRGFE